MSNTITAERLIFTDLAENNNKFWHAELSGTTISANWGRIGDSGQRKTYTFYTAEEAEKDFHRQVAGKLRKGYTRQKTLGDNSPMPIAYVAKVQIDHSNDPETVALIDFLIQRNIHKIEGATNIRLEAGKLTTPLGPVTLEGLDEAEKLLFTMSKTTPTHKEFGDVVNQYLRIIPRKISRHRIDPADLFGTPNQLELEQAMLDSLRAVVKDAEQKAAADVKAAVPVFETKLQIISSSEKDFARINKYYKTSINTRHQSANMKLSRVWEMHIECHDAQFEAKLGNIQELWHGTKDANLLSILKNGYIIPKRNSGVHISGRMFGDGVYFSDQSTKSLNYTTSFWGGQKSQRSFMTLNDVAMGKSYTPNRSGLSTLPKGYDSCFAKANTSGVINNEMIVYRTSQIKPTYLCEFSS